MIPDDDQLLELIKTRYQKADSKTDDWRQEARELYDMIADPGQQNDIAHERPAVAKKLKAAYDAWLDEVTRRGSERPPIPVGYPQMKLVEMPTPEATWHGGLKFGGRHANNNWVTNWVSTDAHVYWDIDVVYAGPYEVTLMYICPEEDVGARVCVEVDGDYHNALCNLAANVASRRARQVGLVQDYLRRNRISAAGAIARPILADLQEAEGLLRRCLQIDPDFAPAAKLLGAVQQQRRVIEDLFARARQGRTGRDDRPPLP